MSIALVGSVGLISSAASALTLSGSFTVAGGNNSILIVPVLLQAGSANNLTATYNGVSMSQAVFCAGNAGGAVSRRICLFYLVNPPAGAHTVAVSWGTACQGYAEPLEYSGVDQVSPIGATVTSNGFDVTLTNTLTIGQAGSLHLANMTIAGAALTAGSGTVELGVINSLFSSSPIACSVGSNTLTSTGVSTQWITAGAEFKAAVISTGTGAGTLDDMTGGGTGEIPNTGVGAGTLDDMTGGGTGTTPNIGAGAGTLDDMTGSGTGDSGALSSTGTGTLDDMTGGGTGNIVNVGTGAGTLDDMTGGGAGTVPVDVYEQFSITVVNANRVLVAGLGNSAVTFEAEQESTGLWFNWSTESLQAGRPAALALLEDIGGNHAAKYISTDTPTKARITGFNQQMLLYWYCDFGDGYGSVLIASARAYYNNGVEILPGLTSAQAFQLAEKPLLSQIVGALPDIPAITAALVDVLPAATRAAMPEIASLDSLVSGVPAAVISALNSRIIDGTITGLQAEWLLLAYIAGKRIGVGTPTEMYMRQDGTTPAITFQPTDAAGNGVPVPGA